MPLDQLIPGLIGLSIFGIPTAYLLWLCWLALSSRRWPSATGRVTRSKVVPGRRERASYDVRYEYEASGRRYTGDRVRFGGALNLNSTDARATALRYPEGGSVAVRYHPRRPAIATLEPRVSGFLWFWLATGLFMVVSISGALVGWWG
jgi:hypothetical protein